MAKLEDGLGVRDGAPYADIQSKWTAFPKYPSSEKRKREDVVETPKTEERRRKQREYRVKRQERERNKIVVGVDFGNTYTGIAYASTARTSKDVEILDKWTGGHNNLQEKVPTKIAYVSQNPQLEEDKWGYDIEAGTKACQWFKLLLDSNVQPTDYDDPLLEQATGSVLMKLPEGKTAKDVATDYLSLIYLHVIKSLQNIIGEKVLEVTELNFELTTPATWSQAARAATKEAASKAGFGSRTGDELTLIDEPESAAIYTIGSAVRDLEGGSFKPKSCVTIVDMGGGTVDLVTFQIIKLDPLQLEEACIGQGGKCGGTTIDRNLHHCLDQRFGNSFKGLEIAKIGASSTFMKEFESNKRDFKGDAADARKLFRLPLKMKKLGKLGAKVQEFYDLEEDMVILTSSDLESFFQPVIEKTQALIKEQIYRTSKAKQPSVKTLILCGGLGGCRYVEKKLREFIDKELHGKVELVWPQKPWSAIARGAAMRGLEKNPVMFRRTRDHIGIMVHKKFDDKIHDQRDFFMCPIRGERAANQMHWFISRGEKVLVNSKRKLSCYLVVTAEEAFEEKIIKNQDLYGCSQENAPIRGNLVDGEIIRIGTIKIDLTTLVHDRLPFGTSKVLEFNVDVEISLANDKGFMLVTAKCGRKVLGDTEFEYDANPAYKEKPIKTDA